MASLKSKTKVKSKSLHLTKVCADLFLNEERADVHFVFDVGGECVKIPGHKFVLAFASPVFYTMFDGRWKEETEVVIKDASPEAFKEFMQFLYKGDVEITTENIVEVMNLANKYDVAEGLNVCEQIVLKQITVDDICFGLDAAILFDRKRLKKHCEKMIRENAATVIASDAFRRCSRNALRCILNIDDLNCEPVKVFDACMDWAKHACEANGTDADLMENRRKELDNCLHLIRFDLMEPSQISESIKKYKGLFNADELEEIFSTMNPDSSNSLTMFKGRKSIVWNETAKLACHRLPGTHTTNDSIQPMEVTVFKMNKRMVFGGVSMDNINTGYQYSYSHGSHVLMSGRMCIMESLTLNGHDNKMLLMQMFTANSNSPNYTKLTKPLLIQPGRVYRILITINNPVSQYCSYKFNQPKETCFGDNCKVTFRGTDSLFSNMVTKSIISTLYFNPA